MALKQLKVHPFVKVVVSDVNLHPYSAWHQVLRVNLDGVFFTCKHAIAAMQCQPGGSEGCSIGCVSSIWALSGIPNLPPYTASKGGVTALARCGRCRGQIDLHIRLLTIPPPRC